jgi:integrase
VPGKLSDAKVKAAKPGEKDYKLADGGGLHLLVKTTGGKYWRYKYRVPVGERRKEKLLQIGPYPEVSLAEARTRHTEAHKQVRDGLDPSQLKQVQKLTRSYAAANSFELVALEWFERHMAPMSESHRVRTKRILDQDLIPQLGSLAIAEIEPPEVLAALRKVEVRSVDIAHRAKQAAGQIFRYAVQTGRAQRDPTADLKGALKSKTKQHYAALTEPSDVGRLMLAIEKYSGTPIVAAALKIAALTFQRPGQVRAMEWAHVDWEQCRWDIPAAAMQKTKKAGTGERPHIVPLSRQAVDILTELHRLTGNGRYVFPSARGRSRCLSDNGMRTALRTMGYDNQTMTPHGFRAMARTLLDEQLAFRVDIIEHQSGHVVKDPNGRAYNRTTFLPDRIKMMQRWADYLGNLKSGTPEC